MPPQDPPTFLASPSFMITCACLTLDPTTNTVLLARTPSAHAATVHQIPQGPKNIDEGLLSAAVRHTLDSTNTPVEPLRTRVPTHAGLWHYGDGEAAPGGTVDNCEPFAVCEVSEGGVRWIVFYYLARRKRVEDGGSGVWVSLGDVEGDGAGLSGEEVLVVRTGVELARKAGVMP